MSEINTDSIRQEVDKFESVERWAENAVKKLDNELTEDIRSIVTSLSLATVEAMPELVESETELNRSIFRGLVVGVEVNKHFLFLESENPQLDLKYVSKSLTDVKALFSEVLRISKAPFDEIEELVDSEVSPEISSITDELIFDAVDNLNYVEDARFAGRVASLIFGLAQKSKPNRSKLDINNEIHTSVNETLPEVDVSAIDTRLKSLDLDAWVKDYMDFSKNEMIIEYFETTSRLTRIISGEEAFAPSEEDDLGRVVLTGFTFGMLINKELHVMETDEPLSEESISKGIEKADELLLHAEAPPGEYSPYSVIKSLTKNRTPKNVRWLVTEHTDKLCPEMVYQESFQLAADFTSVVFDYALKAQSSQSESNSDTDY